MGRNPRLMGGDPKSVGVDSRFVGRDPKFVSVDPKSVGADPKFVGVDPKFVGVDPKFVGVDPKFVGRDPKFVGRDPKFVGVDPKFMGVDPKFVGVDPKFVGRDPKFVGVDPKFMDRDPPNPSVREILPSVDRPVNWRLRFADPIRPKPCGCDVRTPSVVHPGNGPRATAVYTRDSFEPEWRNGRRSRLKICRGIPPCRFESDLGHSGDYMRKAPTLAFGLSLLLSISSGLFAEENPRNDPSLRQSAVHRFVLTPRHPLTGDEQAALRAEGVTFDHNLTGGRYLVRIAGDSGEVEVNPTVASLEPFGAAQKIYHGAYAAAAQGRG